MASSFNEEYATQLGRLKAGLVDAVTGFKTDVKAEIATLRQEIDATRAEMLAPNFRGAGRASDGGRIAGYTSPGAKFIRDADLQLARKTGRLSFPIDQLHPVFEHKTLLDEGTLGFSTPGVIGSQRIEALVPQPRRRLTIRDLLRSRPVTGAQVDWVQEIAGTNAASPVCEGVSKAESEINLQIASAKITTIAHWLPCSKQVLDDLPGLREFIDSALIFGMRLIEENQLLFGDGAAPNILGLCNQAAPYLGTYAVAGDTILDKIRKVKLEMEMLDEQPGAIVMSPLDWATAQLVKTDEGGANTGQYILAPDPLGDGTLRVPLVWNMALVSTPTMPAGSFLCGNFSMATIADREGARIDLSESHEDFFIKNKVAIRVEERISLACMRAGAFRFGSW
jgi:HK97 family phage major capsid protein